MQEEFKGGRMIAEVVMQLFQYNSCQETVYANFRVGMKNLEESLREEIEIS